ncbi:MAG: NitT/TauT family transport system ATP-binding protein [Chloroflexota bacterium]|nr:NitT/TauT family transport system ATP-binding protein [Chloroflexota bacterium]
MDQAASVIALEHVSKTFQDRNGSLEVLQGIHTAIHPQEFLCLLGPSGCGKTTLLRILAGLIEPTSGELRFPLGTAPSIGLVFQQSNLMPWRSVLENILLPLEMRNVPHNQALERAQALIELVGLQEFTHAWPASLSGGMAQRVAIARALIQDPDLLLLDEPFGSLDALTREKMGAELLRIWQARRKTVVMVTHSISEALLLSDRVLVFSPRPARILLDLKVDLPRPRGEDIRYSADFQKMSKLIRTAIQ